MTGRAARHALVADELLPTPGGARPWSLSTRSTLTALIPMAAIVVALASLFVVRSSQNAAVSEVVHADDVQVGAGRSLTLLVDAETSVRGYVSTGDVQFLDTYVRAVAELPASLSTLAELVAHEPVQATRVDQIRLLATSELDTLASMREQVSLGSGQSLVELTKDGKRTMEAIRVRVSAVEAAAEQTRQDRKTHIDGLGLVAFVMTVVAGAIGSLGLVFAWVLRASAETKQRAERDRAAQALATSEEDRWHNALVLASTAEGIATIDADGLCTSMNPMGAKLLGYEPRELIGQGMHGMVHHHHADGSEYPADSCKMMLAARSGQVCRVDDEVFWCKDGTRLPVEYSAAPLLVAGVLSGAVVSFVDISERRAFDSDREQRAAELRAAIGDHQLVLYYQPKIDLKSGSVIGVEALVRWQHPHRGLVFPDDFIPLAERTGVMGHLTAFVLEEAIAQYLEWRASGLELPVAVNLSVDSLADLRFPDRLEALCKRYGVPPSALELEVTESGVMAEPLQAIKVLEILRAKGFALAIDDFGTGFSSLAYLRNLPVRQVKIDKSFVLELPHNDPDAHIVRGIIDLVHGLGKHVVAEGVETAEALAFLVGAGCETAQGYYWSRPLPAADLTVWLHEHSQRIRASVVNPFVPLG